MYTTNEQLFEDLKQFVEVTVSQHTAELGNELRDKIAGVRGEVRELNARMDILDQKLDHVQDAIAETFTQTTEANRATLKDHETRLSRMERRAA